MSKLIVEMEMPLKCVDCRMWSICGALNKVMSEGCDDYCDWSASDLFELTMSEGFTKPNDCLIVGVLPEEHGRLIDADAYQYYGDLADEPTIVPSTRKEQNDESDL